MSTNAATTLMPHQQRMVDEKAYEQEKLDKLEAFLATSIYSSFAPAEQSRLSRQYLVMQLFVQVLEERISAF